MDTWKLISVKFEWRCKRYAYKEINLLISSSKWRLFFSRPQCNQVQINHSPRLCIHFYREKRDNFLVPPFPFLKTMTSQKVLEPCAYQFMHQKLSYNPSKPSGAHTSANSAISGSDNSLELDGRQSCKNGNHFRRPHMSSTFMRGAGLDDHRNQQTSITNADAPRTNVGLWQIAHAIWFWL